MEQGPYTSSLETRPVDENREWARGKDLGMGAPNRDLQRADLGGIVGNRGRAMASADKYASGYRIDDSSVNTVNSRLGARGRFANMEIAPPAQVLDVTKPMG